jgi:Tfp pilus assembly protein PilO
MTTSDLIALAKKNPVIVVCVVLSLGILGAMYFRAGAIDEANKKLEERTALARRYALNLNQSAHLKDQYDTVVAANKAIENRMLRPAEIGINQQFFYKLESDSGVKLLDLRQGGAVKKGAFAPISFTLSYQGDFSQAVAFLRALENGPHYFRLETASFGGGRTGPVSVTLNLELLGNP